MESCDRHVWKDSAKPCSSNTRGASSGPSTNTSKTSPGPVSTVFTSIMSPPLAVPVCVPQPRTHRHLAHRPIQFDLSVRRRPWSLGTSPGKIEDRTPGPANGGPACSPKARSRRDEQRRTWPFGAATRQSAASELLDQRTAFQPDVDPDHHRRRLYELFETAHHHLLGNPGPDHRLGLCRRRMAERQRQYGADAFDCDAGAALDGVPGGDEPAVIAARAADLQCLP